MTRSIRPALLAIIVLSLLVLPAAPVSAGRLAAGAGAVFAQQAEDSASLERELEECWREYVAETGDDARALAVNRRCTEIAKQLSDASNREYHEVIMELALGAILEQLGEEFHAPAPLVAGCIVGVQRAFGILLYDPGFEKAVGACILMLQNDPRPVTDERGNCLNPFFLGPQGAPLPPVGTGAPPLCAVEEGMPPAGSPTLGDAGPPAAAPSMDQWPADRVRVSPGRYAAALATFNGELLRGTIGNPESTWMRLVHGEAVVTVGDAGQVLGSSLAYRLEGTPPANLGCLRVQWGFQNAGPGEVIPDQSFPASMTKVNFAGTVADIFGSTGENGAPCRTAGQRRETPRIEGVYLLADGAGGIAMCRSGTHASCLAGTTRFATLTRAAA